MRIGPKYQAALPELGTSACPSRHDFLCWTPAAENGLKELLECIRARGGGNLSLAQLETALQLITLHGDWELALQHYESQTTSCSLTTEQKEAFRASLLHHEDDLRTIHRILSSTIPYSLSQFVDLYYKHFYLNFGANDSVDGIAFKRSKRTRQLRSGHTPHRRRRRQYTQFAVAEAPRTLASMLGYGLLEPGDGVLSIEGPRGAPCIVADLTPTGSIRWKNAGEEHYFRTPSQFLHATTVRDQDHARS